MTIRMRLAGYRWSPNYYELENAVYLHNIPKEKARRWIAQPILIVVGALVAAYHYLLPPDFQ